MATVIQFKRSETASDAPSASDLAVGEIALNLEDKLFYSKKSDGTVVNMGGAGQAATLPEEYYFGNDYDLGNLTTADASYDFGSFSSATNSYNMGVMITPLISSTAIPTPTSAGTPGEVRVFKQTINVGYQNAAVDYIMVYVCIATNTWNRMKIGNINNSNTSW